MIDYGHFLSAPALSWDAKLIMTNAELKLWKKFMRSEIFYLTKRYSKGNNKKLKSYDSKQESN